jgi:hypothetical protein
LLINQSTHVNNEQKGKGQAPTLSPTIIAVSIFNFLHLIYQGNDAMCQWKPD